MLTRYLDPETIWSELTFGLVMAVTFTVSSRFVAGAELYEHLREIALGAVESNVAWGVIDGVFYVLGEVFDMGRTGLWVRRARSAKNEVAALQAIKEQYGDMIGDVATSAEGEQLYREIFSVLKRMTAPSARPTGDGLIGAGLVVLLVSAASLPVVLPVALISDPHVALRTIYLLLVVCLFASGYGMATAVGLPGLRYGAIMALVGIVLGAIAYALGG